MKEKLTLSIEKETKKRAKQHAKATGKSISEMVEEFLEEVSTQQDWAPPKGSAVEKISNMFPKRDIDYKKELTQALEEKHG